MDDEGRALLSLSVVARPDPQDQVEALRELGFEVLAPDEAIVVLAEHRNWRRRALRPVVIRRVLDLARYRPELVAELAGPLHELHAALANEARLPESAIATAAEVMDQAAADTAARWAAMPMPISGEDDAAEDGDDDTPSGPPLATTGPTQPPPPAPPEDEEPTPSDGYVATVADVLQAPKETVGPPPCEDERRIVWGPQKASGYAVETAWWTKATIDQLRPWTNPANWPRCSHHTFFKNMVEVAGTYGPGPYSQPGDPRFGGRSWVAEFDETVAIAGPEITTRLAFEHFEWPAIGNQGDGPITTMATDYHLVDPQHPGEIRIDHGSLQVQTILHEGASITRVLLTKNIGFTTPAYTSWPTLACDTFFGEIAAMMASNCQQAYTVHP